MTCWTWGCWFHWLYAHAHILAALSTDCMRMHIYWRQCPLTRHHETLTKCEVTHHIPLLHTSLLHPVAAPESPLAERRGSWTNRQELVPLHSLKEIVPLYASTRVTSLAAPTGVYAPCTFITRWTHDEHTTAYLRAWTLQIIAVSLYYYVHVL
jgi:hypothetical protein